MFVYLTVTSLTFLDPLGMSQVMSRPQYSMRFRQGAKENLEVRGFKMLIDTPSQDQQVVLFAQTYKRVSVRSKQPCCCFLDVTLG